MAYINGKNVMMFSHGAKGSGGGGIAPTGTLDVTENGSYDVAKYAEVNVDVPTPEGYIKPEGTLEITENGEHDVTEHAKVNVNVAASGGGDTFWDLFQANGERNYYEYAFYYFNGDAFFPKYDIIAMNADYAFKYFNTKPLRLGQGTPAPFDLAARFAECGVSIRPPEGENYASFAYLFEDANIATTPPIYAIGASVVYMFRRCANLHTIGTLTARANNAYTSTFKGCSSLVNITFGGEIGKNIGFEDSTLLSTASIENIIEHLSDSATSQTLTLSKTAVDNAFATSNNAEGSTTQEWAMLVGTKSNWTISLV